MDQARKGKPSLTVAQQNVLNAVVEYITAKGYPPSIREIGRAVGLASPSTVFSHLMTLERAGYIRRGSHLTRAIEVLDDPVTGENPTRPLVAWVLPNSGPGTTGQALPIPSALFGTGNRAGFVVDDERLVGEHILPGDLLVLGESLPIDKVPDGALIVATISGSENLTGRVRHSETNHVSLFVGDEEIASGTEAELTILGLVEGVLRQTAEK